MHLNGTEHETGRKAITWTWTQLDKWHFRG